ncbi:MAG: hypothetical protein A3H69_03260 [Candidatus Sungbacteria bacterium RIFCSPLOWO2_02_FULL_47_9]|uniref:Uncharacterized protein n=1 Tax=Candidatus Sungbacteria bacterium RIFCSPHIGHO2_01_FULL_47_32 TaxID=1802264 RepID=A0A1G2K3G4_9BACT|nr:MAG: hypothetical protein UX72_C0003G0023 [Parcubacteria group bacterium GW2011_GWA2_47_10]OGZ93957.1 MAG: hypothetical protein A2633_00760 [Candidatus Sungbacteria bacterium RIFCSPHIGHO2_01_FULL_47_32]OHA10404.1 MAG: hypothetical protein A3H69_03260 [Candidatus Sungbacteria bacterium RIFCSPLOWO2_02_FULL_47_9]
MEPEILKKLEEQGQKIDVMCRSFEKLRKMFLWLIIISVAVVVLPAIGLLFVIPQFLSVYNTSGF